MTHKEFAKVLQIAPYEVERFSDTIFGFLLLQLLLRQDTVDLFDIGTCVYDGNKKEIKIKLSEKWTSLIDNKGLDKEFIHKLLKSV
jgi:hypothetical protein